MYCPLPLLHSAARCCLKQEDDDLSPKSSACLQQIFGCYRLPSDEHVRKAHHALSIANRSPSMCDDGLQGQFDEVSDFGCQCCHIASEQVCSPASLIGYTVH